MNTALSQRQTLSLRDDVKTYRKLELNQRRNKQQDQSANLEAAVAAFRYEDCKNEYWNPERFSLLHNTPLWDGATQSQRVMLNQLYWVAYYSQIISAEIATIFFNQTCAAGLYQYEDFKLVCDTLDLESAQERAHIAAFKSISEEVEAKVFGERLFTYPMRPYFAETMIFNDRNRLQNFWKRIQLQAFTLISSSNAFLACQYFTVRGLRTLKGKLIQHQLSEYWTSHADREHAPIPSKVSYFHFMDESYHFNSSTIIGHEVVNSLPAPTRFERTVANLGLWGCQKDHFNFSVAVRGIFWADPALYRTLYRLCRSKVFGMSDRDAKEMVRRCFTEETQALHDAYETHVTAVESYRAYLADFSFVSADNKEMALMRQNSIPRYLEKARLAFRRFSALELPAPNLCASPLLPEAVSTVPSEPSSTTPAVA